MKRAQSQQVAAWLAVAAAIAFSGCESDSDSNWTAPANVSGHWVEVAAPTEGQAYRLDIDVSPSQTSATYHYTCIHQDCAPNRRAYPASYDATNGVLTVYYDLECWREYFRFRGDSRMYRVRGPGNDDTLGEIYMRQ